ncbi:MAG: UDP-glucose 4-epimerase GalE [Trueperaceae bacterium]
MNILVTGGAGYIGSHTCVELLNEGHTVIVVDNLVNSNQEALKRVEDITGKGIHFYKVDLLDKVGLESVFAKHEIDAVIHFGALKAVGESVAQPLRYYQNNITGTLVLCEVMQQHGVKHLVFSSSATVYGTTPPPLREDAPRDISAITNPYGRTKLMIEEILRDVNVSDEQWNVILLRYFNPVGAHTSGRIGEDPSGIPNNLMPYVAQVAVGKLEELTVHGDDYPTKDGTGVRDYIHVVDLAIGHVRALDKLKDNPGVVAYNLGTGQGYSVLEVIAAYQKASGKTIAYKIGARRSGDQPSSYADPSKAQQELGWKAVRGLDEMCEDSWRWQAQNPKGFES